MPLVGSGHKIYDRIRQSACPVGHEKRERKDRREKERLANGAEHSRALKSVAYVQPANPTRWSAFIIIGCFPGGGQVWEPLRRSAFLAFHGLKRAKWSFVWVV